MFTGVYKDAEIDFDLTFCPWLIRVYVLGAKRRVETVIPLLDDSKDNAYARR